MYTTHMKKTIIFTSLVTTLAIVGAVAYLGLEYLNFRNQELQANAVQGCMEISTFTNENAETGVTTQAPMMDVYEKCMQEKHLK